VIRMSSKLSLCAEERETVLSWTDEERDVVFVYSSQQPMIRKLLKNPLFEVTDQRFNEDYTCHPNPISIEGTLPLRALTIRKKFVKLTAEQVEERAERLKEARKVSNG